jgi:hypothetical protein
MTNKDLQTSQGATDSGARPGSYPLGSALSRAAARSLVAARKSSEEEFRVQTVSILDGRPVNLDGLAERLSAARLRPHAEEDTAASPTGMGGQDSNKEGGANCLEERLRRARERLAQDLETMR